MQNNGYLKLIRLFSFIVYYCGYSRNLMLQTIERESYNNEQIYFKTI